MNNICQVKIYQCDSPRAQPKITKRHESTRNVTKQHLGKSLYLGRLRSIYGSIIDFYLFQGIAEESGNPPKESLRESPAELSLLFLVELLERKKL